MAIFLQSIYEVHFLTPSFGSIVSGVLALILLFASAFASGSEIAFFSLTPKDLNDLEESNDARDKQILSLREDGQRTLATILITNNLVNVTIIILCNYFITQLISFGNSVFLQFLVLTVLLTFVLLLFGEIIPKVYCGQNQLSFCRFSVKTISFLRRLFYPLSNILLRTGALTEKVVVKENHTLSVDDLEQALELTDKGDLKDEQTMLEGIVRFSDETAKEIMTSRQDIVGLDFRSSFHQVIKSIIDNNYSRIPVYQDGVDNVRGILYIKDLLPHIGKADNFRWQSLIRPPYFVPETKKIDDLLREFQENKVHIAIVVDEFGGTSGLVTLEDILEEIVGEIHDEYDEEEKSFVRVNANTYIFEGKTLLSDFYKILDIDDNIFTAIEGDADTLAGLMLELKGDFPQKNECLQYQQFHFEIVDIAEHRISKVKVVIQRDHQPMSE